MNKKRAGRGARGRLLILFGQEKGLAMVVSQGWLGDGPLSPLAGRGPCCDGTARAQEGILKRRVETRARAQAFSTSRSVRPCMYEVPSVGLHCSGHVRTRTRASLA